MAEETIETTSTEETSQSDGSQNTANAGTETAKTSGTEFTPEQQVTIQGIVDRTLIKGRKQGSGNILGNLGIDSSEVDSIKGLIAELKASGDNISPNSDGTEGTTEEQSTSQSEKKLTKAEQETQQWQARFQALQTETTRQHEELQAKLQKQHDIAANSTIDAALSTALSGFQLAESVRPDEILLTLKQSVKVDDNMLPMIVDPDGNPKLDASGENLSVDAYVRNYMTERPHNLAPEGRSGSGANSVSQLGSNSIFGDVDLNNFRPGQIKDALESNPDALKMLQDVLKPKSDINPFALAKQNAAKE